MRPKPTIPCAVANCGRAAIARGLCPHHYFRLRSYGDPLGTPTPRKRKDPTTDRHCPGCALVLPAAAFVGWYRKCRDCLNAARRRGYPRERTKRLENAKRYAEANRERVLAYKKAYQQQNRQALGVKAKAWVDANREKRRAIARNYNRRHPDKMAEGRHSRRARMKGARVEVVSMDVLYARDGGICQICKRPVAREKASMDHIIPIVDGGAHALWNVQLAHLTCNLRRNRGYIPAQTRLPI